MCVSSDARFVINIQYAIYNDMPMRQGLKSTGDENLRSFHGEEPEQGVVDEKDDPILLGLF
jgi:hypothetical protein